MEAPNLAGSTVCALIGLVCGACAYAWVRGLIPSLLRTAAEPVVWLLKARVLHRFEEVDAQCVGIIWRETGDEDVSYYPFFQYTVEGEQLHWFPSHRMSRKRYRPGGRYTLYRDTVTGGCALRPGAMELLSALHPVAGGLCGGDPLHSGHRIRAAAGGLSGKAARGARQQQAGARGDDAPRAFALVMSAIFSPQMVFSSGTEYLRQRVQVGHTRVHRECGKLFGVPERLYHTNPFCVVEVVL